MLKVPIRLMRMTRSKSASGIGPSRPTMRLAGPMPAQLTRTRAGAVLGGGLLDRGSALALSVTSQVTAMPPISVATSRGGLGVDVEHRDLGAGRRERARGRGAEAGGAAGDDGGLSLDVHGSCPLRALRRSRATDSGAA